MNKLVIVIITLLFVVIGVIYSWVFFQVNDTSGGSEITILRKWELPEILIEISGIAYMGNNKIACVQDEDGIIFIFNLETSAIEKQIDFAGPGDYEAITLVGSTAYVLRSDGVLYEILNFNNSIPEIRQYNMGFPSKYNFEGLAFDAQKNRLLLGLKEGAGKKSAPFFAFNLDTRKLERKPVFELNSEAILKEFANHKLSGKLRPSDITIHPQTLEIFVLQGVNPQLYILNTAGNLEDIVKLNKKKFPQAEGITFGSNGEIYISNEGNGTSATIIQISLNKPKYEN